MSVSFTRLGFVSCLATVAVALAVTATPADAAGYTIKVGTSASGTGSQSGASTGSITFLDASTNTSIVCSSGTVSGPVTLGAPPIPRLVIAKSTWLSCSIPSLPFTVATSGSWNLDFIAYANGVTAMNFNPLSLKLTASGCSYAITGSTDATFTNSTQVLAVKAVSGSSHVLHISSVVGCFGLVRNGDLTTITADYKVTAKNASGVVGPLTITSP